MLALSKKAREAASQLVGEVASVKHAATLEAGEQVFHIKCRERPSTVTVTINPNGNKATVEWKSGTRGTNYKICNLGRHMTITREEKKITS